jgi:3-methyl-2-oxobutanoate hydroxymethyltransferase
MSTQNHAKRLTIADIRARKGQKPVVTLTAYDALMARLVDAVADVIIVGDSLGMVRLGFDSTVPVTLDMMILHAQAVMRGSERACIVVDMPFGSVQESKEQAYRHAARMMQETGCSAVKLEGGLEMSETVRFLTQRGIPVMAHIGLKPQHVQQMGGYRVQAKDDAGQAQLLEEAKSMEEAGAFSLLLEGIPAVAGKAVSQAVKIPTIGIGAGKDCDGQVLVTEDLLGMNEKTAKFVKRYVELGTAIREAVEAYAEEVKAREFPAPSHNY